MPLMLNKSSSHLHKGGENIVTNIVALVFFILTSKLFYTFIPSFSAHAPVKELLTLLSKDKFSTHTVPII